MIENYEISFTKRVSKMGPHLVIKVPKDRRDDFDHKDLVKIVLVKKNSKLLH